jgi:hypothetical protein
MHDVDTGEGNVPNLNPRITAAAKTRASRKVPPGLAKLRMRNVPDC